METFNSSNGTDSKYVTIPGVSKFEEFFTRTKTSDDKNYAALKLIQRSYNRRRSTNSATIVFLGLSNAGISHTINRILNQSIMTVGRPTQEIIECSFEMPCNSLKIQNAQVRLIDTPGFGGSYKEFNPTCYSTLVRYFQEQNYLPNFIFLIVNITEKDLECKGGWFLVHLQKIKSELSSIIDPSANSNLIVYLTHICSSSPSVQNDPSKLIQIVEEMIEENLGIKNVPIVVGENRAEAYNLGRVTEFYVLPSGTFFPRNIYWEMIKHAVSMDPVGHSLISEMLDNFAQLPFLDIDKCAISVEDAAIIKSPPAIHADLIGIDFNPEIRVPLLVDLGDEDPNTNKILQCFDAELENPVDEEFQYKDTPEVNKFAEIAQLLALSTSIEEIDQYFEIKEGEESFNEERLSPKMEIQDLIIDSIPTERHGDDFEISTDVQIEASIDSSNKNSFESLINSKISDRNNCQWEIQAELYKAIENSSSNNQFATTKTPIKSNGNIVPDPVEPTPDCNNNGVSIIGRKNNSGAPSEPATLPQSTQCFTDSEDISVFEPDPQEAQTEENKDQLVFFTTLGVGLAGLALFAPKVYAWLKML